MQIVIDILPEEYEAICKVDAVVNVIPFRIAQVIKDGTVLPENHGNLKDENDVKRELIEEYRNVDILKRCLDKAPTIIEGTEGKE